MGGKRDEKMEKTIIKKYKRQHKSPTDPSQNDYYLNVEVKSDLEITLIRQKTNTINFTKLDDKECFYVLEISQQTILNQMKWLVGQEEHTRRESVHDEKLIKILLEQYRTQAALNKIVQTQLIDPKTDVPILLTVDELLTPKPTEIKTIPDIDKHCAKIVANQKIVQNIMDLIDGTKDDPDYTNMDSKGRFNFLMAKIITEHGDCNQLQQYKP